MTNIRCAIKRGAYICDARGAGMYRMGESIRHSIYRQHPIYIEFRQVIPVCESHRNLLLCQFSLKKFKIIENSFIIKSKDI